MGCPRQDREGVSGYPAAIPDLGDTSPARTMPPAPRAAAAASVRRHGRAITRTIVTTNKAAASAADGARGVYAIKTQWSHGGAARAVLKQARVRAGVVRRSH